MASLGPNELTHLKRGICLRWQLSRMACVSILSVLVVTTSMSFIPTSTISCPHWPSGRNSCRGNTGRGGVHLSLSSSSTQPSSSGFASHSTRVGNTFSRREVEAPLRMRPSVFGWVAVSTTTTRPGLKFLVIWGWDWSNSWRRRERNINSLTSRKFRWNFK